MRSQSDTGADSPLRNQRMVPRTRLRLRQKTVWLAAGSFSFLVVISMVVYLQFSKPLQVYAAVSGDYRSAASGNWNSAATWQIYNGSSWVAASTYPTYTDGVITIRSGYPVTNTAGVSVDQVVIEAGGQLTLTNGTFKVVNGTGTDLTNNGAIIFSATFTIDNSATVSDFGQITENSGGSVSFNAGAQIMIESGGVYTKVNGSLTATAGYWVVKSGGTYEHADNGGNMPNADWQTGSTCLVTGTTTSVPSNLDQSFFNFKWNCTGQTSLVNFGSALTVVTANMTVISTGAGSIKLNQGSNMTLTVGGDYIQQGGIFELTETGSPAMNVAGNVTITGGEFRMNDATSSTGNGNPVLNVTSNFSISAATLDMSQYTGTNTSLGKTTINLSGNLTIGSGGIIKTTSATVGNGTMIFAKSGTQQFLNAGTITNAINFTINSGSIVNAGTSMFTGSGAFTLNSGGELVIGLAQGITSAGASGIVQCTGTRTFSTGGNYTYNGSAAQVTGNGLPTTINKLTLNNSSGLTLTNTVAVGGILTLSNGNITTGSNEVSVTDSATTSVSGYSSSGYIVGNLRRAIKASGSYDFPVGTSANYELINATFTSQVGVSNIVGLFTASAPTLSSPVSYGGKSFSGMLNHGYWTLTPNATLTSGVYAVTLIAKGQTNATGTDSSQFIVLKRHDSGSSWALSGTPNLNAQLVSNGKITTSVTGLTTFSDFGEGATNSGGSLPIKLMYFRAKLNGDHVNLDWATASEINNDFFTIERSNDGVNFEKLISRKGGGNSTTTLYYNAVDDSPVEESYSYYRLKQTDYDGHYTYSPIESIKNGGRDKDALAPEIKIESVAPNPFAENFKLGFMLKTATVIDLRIFNLSGQIVYATKIPTTDGYNNYEFRDETNLPKGIYFLNLSYADQRVTQKIVKG